MSIPTMVNKRARMEDTPSSPSASCSDYGHAEAADSELRGRKRQARPNFPTQIDWRGVLCQSLGLNEQEQDDTLMLQLGQFTKRLEAAEDALHDAARPDTKKDLNYQIVHRIRCADEGTSTVCLREPSAFPSEGSGFHLRGYEIVDNWELHLERSKDTILIVYRDYGCCSSSDAVLHTLNRQQDHEAILEALRIGESVEIVCDVLQTALQKLWVLIDSPPSPSFELEEEFNSPYTWWYLQRENIKKVAGELDAELLCRIEVFQKYIHDSLDEEYEVVDELLMHGKTMTKYLSYLFAPGELCLSKQLGTAPQFHTAFVASAWATVERIRDADHGLAHSTVANNAGSGAVVMVPGISWSYDGSFQKEKNNWTFKCPFGREETFDIQDLEVFPLHFADRAQQNALKKRGEMFWQCRLPKYVRYRDKRASGIQSLQDERYMIDYKTYKEMHQSTQPAEENNDDLGEEATREGAPPPSDDSLFCLPHKIPGFHMRKKEWIELYVSRMSDVQWNDKAFERLVVEDEKKKLIKALVTTKITTEESGDLMAGKGNGLFILLHGGPGTGKTLTAESVAEIARKPLYRVTCGDVGTKAEDVESYLEIVLLLGRKWGCIVLLDEADVFLMQRSVEDFKRNALVSVFLRVLEYYEGILILTSNRVGSFDAAFKSRIQLSLRYPTLRESDREKIWNNLLTHMDEQARSHGTSRGISLQEILRKLPVLAKKSLNGREIRNALSTARQLAICQDEEMGYGHLEIVLAEMAEFEAYATELKGGLTDETIARECQEY